MRRWFVLAFIAALLATAAIASCGVPLGAYRRTPPDGIDARVLATKATAPDFTLGGTTGSFHLADAIAKEHVLLVFYRGHW
jgi:hypothetical protein